MMNYRTYQIVNGKVKYTEDYTIGEDFDSYDEMIEALDELIGECIDSYTIEKI
ncbi:MAG: hypothetical protein IJG87_03800 [Ruminococcus sp.]|nr:hypothetical protein [Ruminococcus sp.]